MKSHLLFILLLPCLITHGLNKKLPTGQPPRISVSQSDGIPISQGDFDHLVKKFTKTFEKGDSIRKISEYIKVARLFNTIYYSDLHNVEKYKRFLNLYIYSSRKYLEETIKALGAQLQKGLSYYSEKYGIGLGGDLEGDNVYEILR
ncbi:MAG TPA: hypothetical protein VGN20_20210 [Mucilaginibacter sp.]|jgi:hypothetical protein